MLHFRGGDPFTSGAASYDYRPATLQEAAPRIILRLRIEDFETTGFVDTGGVYLLLSPEVADHLGLRPDDGIPTAPLMFRNNRVSGTLHRVSLTLPADQGDDLTIEVRAFAPQLTPFQEWPNDFPCILGLMGCLERLRFAVDPTNDIGVFHFGEIG
jgi:hypothetical protein